MLALLVGFDTTTGDLFGTVLVDMNDSDVRKCMRPVLKQQIHDVFMSNEDGNLEEMYGDGF